MNENEALLLGIILGDGCVGKYGKHQYRIQISGHSIDDKAFLLNVVKPLFKSIFNKDVKIYKRSSSKTTDLVLYSKEAFEAINRYFRIQEINKRGVFIADAFLNERPIMKGITAGFLATDGSVVITNNNGTVYPRVEFQNVSYKILLQIQEFLLKIGLEGGLYRMDRKHGTVYRLQYNGKTNLLKFKDSIGFINPKHELKFDKYIKNVGVV